MVERAFNNAVLSVESVVDWTIDAVVELADDSVFDTVVDSVVG